MLYDPTPLNLSKIHKNRIKPNGSTQLNVWMDSAYVQQLLYSDELQTTVTGGDGLPGCCR